MLDLGRIYQGPWCGTLLALAGASVVKVEEPAGEPARQRGNDVGTTVPLAMLNSNKQAITLNLKHERGRAMLLDLVCQFDVLIENFGPGVMERLGLGAETLLEVNPRLVYGGATGYGIDGPDRDRLALDITIQAHSGVMSVTGFPDSAPVKAGVAFIDFLGGTYLYGGIVTALYERERTGRGRIVDVAMIDTVYPTMASNMSGYYRDGEARRYGNGHGGGALFPYDVFPTADGYVAILVVTTQQWPNFCNAMGRPELIDDERFASNNRRYRNSEAINAVITEWTSALTRDEVVARLPRRPRAGRRRARCERPPGRSASARARRHPAHRSPRTRPRRRSPQPDSLARHATRAADARAGARCRQPRDLRTHARARRRRDRPDAGGRRAVSSFVLSDELDELQRAAARFATEQLAPAARE